LTCSVTGPALTPASAARSVSELADLAAWLPSGWTLGTLLASALAIALAGVVRGLTGFGFSALAVSSLSLWLPPAQVVPPVLLLEVLASFWLLPSVWRDIHWNWMAWLVAGNVVGIPLGVMLLADGDANLVKAGSRHSSSCSPSRWRGAGARPGTTAARRAWPPAWSPACAMGWPRSAAWRPW
jgi:hypothetical protein